MRGFCSSYMVTFNGLTDFCSYEVTMFLIYNWMIGMLDFELGTCISIKVTALVHEIKKIWVIVDNSANIQEKIDWLSGFL